MSTKHTLCSGIYIKKGIRFKTIYGVNKLAAGKCPCSDNTHTQIGDGWIKVSQYTTC